MTRSVWALALCALVFGACGDSSAEDSASSSSSVATTTTFDRAAEEQAVIDAYLAGLDAFYAAANPPNPDHPDLAKTATGPLLAGVQKNLTELRDQGIGIRKGEATQNNPVVKRLQGRAALVEDCGVDGDVKFELSTDDVVDDSVISGLSLVKMIKRDGRWIANEITFEERPCDGS
ncbi:MAG: hypothetical protein HYU28_08590 [Actinobacteria bacterium]|nr:hypothetical protein [Actinomycetota bacterium]